MAPTKKEVEKRIERISHWLENTVGRPFKWINQVQNFNNSFKKSTSYLSKEAKLMLKERGKSLQLYFLEKELVQIENRIKEMREKQPKNPHCS